MNRESAAEEEVLLVNDQDEALGTMGKLQAHREGVLHRAFSVFLFDEDGRLLLQRRASSKYHSAGLWTNTCCSHPRPDEDVTVAARRRLREEMGIEAELEPRFSFLYRASFENGLHEHELDHVFFGRWSGTPTPDPAEAADWRYANLDTIEMEMRQHPENFTIWLRACWDQVREHIQLANIRP